MGVCLSPLAYRGLPQGRAALVQGLDTAEQVAVSGLQSVDFKHVGLNQVPVPGGIEARVGLGDEGAGLLDRKSVV